jgi:hypothetical protein
LCCHHQKGGECWAKDIQDVGFDDNKDLSPCQGIKAHKMDSVMKENEESYDELHANIL